MRAEEDETFTGSPNEEKYNLAHAKAEFSEDLISNISSDIGDHILVPEGQAKGTFKPLMSTIKSFVGVGALGLPYFVAQVNSRRRA